MATKIFSILRYILVHFLRIRAECLFQGGYKNKAGDVKVNLLLIHFKDESDIHFIYSPNLDLTGYAENLIDAKKSFEIVFEDFVDYALKKKTLAKILTNFRMGIKRF